MHDRVIDWWRRRRWTRARYPRVEYRRAREDLPERPSRRAIVIVGTPEHPKWAIFACPCGHGHIIEINLSGARNPTWRVRESEHGPSLFPSVDARTDFRRCHFWLRDGRAQWALDDEAVER